MGTSASLDNPCELAGAHLQARPFLGSINHLHISIMLFLRAWAYIQR